MILTHISPTIGCLAFGSPAGVAPVQGQQGALSFSTQQQQAQPATVMVSQVVGMDQKMEFLRSKKQELDMRLKDERLHFQGYPGEGAYRTN